MRDAKTLSPPDQALLTLLDRLDACGYDFVTITPESHARVLRRPEMRQAHDLRGVLGWSLPFAREDLPADIVELLARAEVLEPAGDGLLKSAIRVSRVHGLAFIHSAYPTHAADAVFLGPDSYRFADFVAAELSGRSWIGRVVDIGGGGGVGALTAAQGRKAGQLRLTDVNPLALRFARINAAHAGAPLEAVAAPDLQGAPDGCDLILANPPYIAGSPGQTYQDGGDMHGGRISFEWAKAALPKLAPGGRLLLYTGSAILPGGRNELCHALSSAAADAGCRLRCRELDPDVFGEELDNPAYAGVERIAAIGCVITKPRGTDAQS